MPQKARNRKAGGNDRGGVSNPRGKSATNHQSDHVKSVPNAFNIELIFRIILIVLAGGLIVFLFYPDISAIVSKYRESGNGETSRQDLSSSSDSARVSEQDTKGNEKFKRNAEDSIAEDKDQSSKEEVNVGLEEFTELEGEDENDDADEQEKTEAHEQTVPVVLKPDTKQDKSSKLASKSKTKSDERSATETPSDKKKDSPPNKATTKSISESKPEVPKEVSDFKATYLTKFTPKKIFQDGRRIPPVELLPEKPNNSSVKVFLFDEFFSDAECDGLMKAHNHHVSDTTAIAEPIMCFDSISTLKKHLKDAGKSKLKVNPNDFTRGTTCVNATFSRQLKDWFQGNWSYSTAFYPGESRFTDAFDYRVKEAMGLDPKHGGKFQLTSYPSEAAYKTHADCVLDGTDKRDRVVSVLVYLTTVDAGGETTFPDLGIWARPRKGRALVWNNMNEKGECEPMSQHTANKVEKGHKVILIRWYYYKNFYSLGKRPPEPELPPRQTGQARVSCDEYEFGSCRWYDEWNYDHLLDYQRQQYTLI